MQEKVIETVNETKAWSKCRSNPQANHNLLLTGVMLVIIVSDLFGI